MDNVKFDQFVERIPQLIPKLTNEEQTKASLITPFIQMLGYDVFDPHEVQREFTADAGRGNEAVDYAILREHKPVMLIEAKQYPTPLTATTEKQLRRYFNAIPDCRIGVLTNGVNYRVFSDLEAQNVMDDEPLVEWDMQCLSAEARRQVDLFSRAEFDIDSLLEQAQEARYGAQLHQWLLAQRTDPDPDFVRLWARKVYSGPLTAKQRDRFAKITRRVMSDFVSKEVTSALAAIVTPSEETEEPRERRSPFRFDDAGIPLGAVLTFNDGPDVTVIVRDVSGLRALEFDGELVSIRGAGQRARDRREEPYSLGTSPYDWCYEGERLTDRRKRMEAEGTYGASVENDGDDNGEAPA